MAQSNYKWRRDKDGLGVWEHQVDAYSGMIDRITAGPQIDAAPRTKLRKAWPTFRRFAAIGFVTEERTQCRSDRRPFVGHRLASKANELAQGRHEVFPPQVTASTAHAGASALGPPASAE